MWIWLGDAGYYDKLESNLDPSSEEHARKVLERTLNAKGYRDLMETTKIIGTWDDHDMGENDANSEFVLKDRNRDIYLDFIGEAIDSERRL